MGTEKEIWPDLELGIRRVWECKIWDREPVGVPINVGFELSGSFRCRFAVPDTDIVRDTTTDSFLELFARSKA